MEEVYKREGKTKHRWKSQKRKKMCGTALQIRKNRKITAERTMERSPAREKVSSWSKAKEWKE